VKVLINAISVSEGGGLVVLKNLVLEMALLQPAISWYVAASPATLSKLDLMPNVTGIPFSWANKSPLHLFYWYEWVVPRLIRQFKIDLFFSQTNFLPKRKLACHSLLLVQHAGYFSDKFSKLYLKWAKKLKYLLLWKQKNRWAYQSIHKATMVTVQTTALAKKIKDKLLIASDRLFVVPHGTGLLKNDCPVSLSFPSNMEWRIGYITKFGVQKDFDTAIEAIHLLKRSGFHVKLILTLEQKSDEFLLLMKKIRQLGIEDNVENHGDISNPDKIKKLYESLHMFIFPSWCESFGFTLVEAMAMGLPIVASDTESNREISGDAGIFFPPGDASQLAEKIKYFMNDSDQYSLFSKNSLERAKQFCWKKTAKQMIYNIHMIMEK